MGPELEPFSVQPGVPQLYLRTVYSSACGRARMHVACACVYACSFICVPTWVPMCAPMGAYVRTNVCEFVHVVGRYDEIRQCRYGMDQWTAITVFTEDALPFALPRDTR